MAKEAAVLLTTDRSAVKGRLSIRPMSRNVFSARPFTDFRARARRARSILPPFGRGGERDGEAAPNSAELKIRSHKEQSCSSNFYS